MSLISRRQKELLLNDVARMINNNNHAAFANHAKISDSVSNGDLKFFIDSPKKEFVIKYGKKEIRLNCTEQNITELKEIKFSSGCSIIGISDSSTVSSSKIALSTKGADSIKSELTTQISNTHDDLQNKIDQKADINHTHNDLVTNEDVQEKLDLKADKTELTTQLSNKADKNHSHNYADKNHTHNYADKDHTHWNLPLDRDDFEEEIKTIVNGSKAWRIVKKVFKGIEIASDVVQYGLIAGMQVQINSLYAAMSANGLIDTAQSASTIGTALLGYSDKFSTVANAIGKVGDYIEPLSDVSKKIAEPINKVSEYLGKYSKIVDEWFDVNNLTDMTDAVKAFQNSSSAFPGTPHHIPNSTPLPNLVEVFAYSRLG